MKQHSQPSFFFSQGYKLLSLPRILCMHLKRFRNSSYGTRKLECTVTFPETFNVSETLKGAFSTDFAKVLEFPVNYPNINFFVVHNFICSSRLTAGTLCTQWSCTLALQCLDTTLLTFVTGRTSAGTTQTTAT